MANRAYAFSLKLVVLTALVAIASFANVQESSARKKNFWAGIKCECACSGSDHLDYRQYDAVASCSSYNNKTCNYESDTGGVRTGHLVGCKGRIPADESAVDSSGGLEQEPTPTKPKKTPRAPTSGSRGGSN